MDHALSRECSVIVRNFERSCPPRVVKPPQWDASLVLNSLRGPLYGPFKRTSVKNLTRKKVPLLALISAREWVSYTP